MSGTALLKPDSLRPSSSSYGNVKRCGGVHRAESSVTHKLMESYAKARTVERPSVCPFPGLPSDTPEVRVKEGSKIRNPLRFALSRMEAKRVGEDEEVPMSEDGGMAAEGQQEVPGRALCKQIVFTASGKGIAKAITCVEIMKRRVKGLHQLTRLLFSNVDEVWEPLEPTAGLDSLTVSRNLPNIWILLSREPLDCSQAGYQAPGRYDSLWTQSNQGGGGGLSGQRPGHKRKKGGGGRGWASGPGRQTGRSRESTKGQS